MPHFVFLPPAAGIGLGYIRQQAAEEKRQEVKAEARRVEPANRELDWEDIDQVEVALISVRLGAAREHAVGRPASTRIRGIRKKSAELGFLIQSIRIRDNLDLKPEVYRTPLHGVVRGTGDVRVGVTINSSGDAGAIDENPTTEPAFGFHALGIESSQAELARARIHGG